MFDRKYLSNNRIESNDIEDDARKIVKCQNSNESTLLDKENSTPATEFSNVECDAAAKNGNPKNLINITKYSPNPSNNKSISHSNPKKSNVNSLISEWAGSDLNC